MLRTAVTLVGLSAAFGAGWMLNAPNDEARKSTCAGSQEFRFSQAQQPTQDWQRELARIHSKLQAIEQLNTASANKQGEPAETTTPTRVGSVDPNTDRHAAASTTIALATERTSALGNAIRQRPSWGEVDREWFHTELAKLEVEERRVALKSLVEAINSGEVRTVGPGGPL